MPDPNPGRRRFLAGAGGLLLVVAGGGCTTGDGGGDGDGDGAAPGPPSMPAGDADLLVAGAELERTAAALLADLLHRRANELAGVAAVAELYRSQHLEVAELIDEQLVAGGEPPVAPDARFAGATVPTSDELADETVLRILGEVRDLEDALAQTHLTAVERFSTATLRQLAVLAATASARHTVALDLLLGGGLPGYRASTIIAGEHPTQASYLFR